MSVSGRIIKKLLDTLTDTNTHTHTHTHTHTQEYYSALKKNGNPVIFDNVDNLEGIMLNEISQTKTNTVWY